MKLQMVCCLDYFAVDVVFTWKMLQDELSSWSLRKFAFRKDRN